LGVLGDGRAIGGIDLDTCRAVDGTLAPWAAEVVARIGSYTEVSPSGTGAKVFFIFSAAELASLPAFMGKGPATRAARSADSSRSAVAFRKGVALRSAGRTYDEMVEALRTDPETADWCREKGDANGGRELQRIWDKAAHNQWLVYCQHDSEGNLRSNLANTLV